MQSRFPSAKEVDGTHLPSDIGLGELVSLNRVLPRSGNTCPSR